jgi:hypothetical protein
MSNMTNKAVRDLKVLGSDEFKREQARKALAVETQAEYEVVEEIIRDLDGVLNEVHIAQRLGDISSPEAQDRTLAAPVVGLVRVLYDISQADFESGYLSGLKKAAKHHVKEMTHLRNNWSKYAERNEVIPVKKKISAAYEQLIHELKRIHKHLGKESKELADEFKHKDGFFTFR